MQKRSIAYLSLFQTRPGPNGRYTYCSQLTSRTSFEIDTTGSQARAVALVFDKGQPFWRLEVIGATATRSNTVGGLAESFQTVSTQPYLADFAKLLKRLGMFSFKW